MKQNPNNITTDQIFCQNEAEPSAESVGEESLRRRILSHPDSQDPYLMLGDLLHRNGDQEGAIVLYRQALSLNPGWGEIYHNLGNSLLALRRFPEALEAFINVTHILPGFAESHVTAATVLQAMGRPREALAHCDLALELDPRLAEAHWNRALVLLQLGEYADGWREFSWRWQKRGYTTPYRHFPQPLWQGEPLQGRTILVHSEQAFGDTIMFSRYIPLVVAMGGRVICECPEPLVRLMSSVIGVSSVVTAGSELPGFDFHVPLLTLPLIFDTRLDTITTDPLWIEIKQQDVVVWQQRLAHYSGLRVGIAWSGRPLPDPARSCPFHFLYPLGDLEGITFFSLQIGIGAENANFLARMLPMVDLTGEITDFADTAALIQNLDLIISIDTAVAHLAGALGRPTWIMLPFAADWRWLLEREDSPWYPTMRLFRQILADDWSEVITRVLAALVGEVAKGTATSFEGLYQGGFAALQCGDLIEARLLLERAYDLNTQVPELYNALGVLASKEADNEKAEQLLRQAIALDSGYADPLINLGNLKYDAGDFHESANLLLNAIEIAPDVPRGWQNLGVILQGCGKIAEASRCFHRALTLNPDYATALWNLANLQLLTGDYQNGWNNFEARFIKSDPIALRHQNIRRWNGCQLAKKCLLVHAEQGYGDTIQFARYLPLLHNFGGSIIFESPDRSLLKLLKCVSGIDRILVRGETSPPADFQIPLLSLPGIMGTQLHNIPCDTPYLVAPEQRIAAWGNQMSGDEGMRVGLCWFGRIKPDPRRSCPLHEMAPLATVVGVTFHSLQLRQGAEQALLPPLGMCLRDNTNQLVDFNETASLISNLDLVISIDSAVAHLAGALGKQVWLLLPFAPDWRWLLEREDSPWYPTMRLFRQSRQGDWAEVIERVTAELGTTVATYRGRRLPDFV